MSVRKFAELLDDLIKEHGYDKIKKTVLSIFELYEDFYKEREVKNYEV